ALGEHPDDGVGRGLADVVRVRLEGEAPDGDPLAFERAAEVVEDALAEQAALPLVDAEDGLEDLEAVAVLLRGADERLHVLRKTRAAEADAGVEELRADAAVGPDAVAHLVHVGA